MKRVEYKLVVEVEDDWTDETITDVVTNVVSDALCKEDIISEHWIDVVATHPVE